DAVSFDLLYPGLLIRHGSTLDALAWTASAPLVLALEFIDPHKNYDGRFTLTRPDVVNAMRRRDLLIADGRVTVPLGMAQTMADVVGQLDDAGLLSPESDPVSA